MTMFSQIAYVSENHTVRLEKITLKLKLNN